MRFLLVPAAVILVLFIPAQQVPAQQVGLAQSQVDVPPVLRPGDWWTYRWNQNERGRRSDGTYTRQVVRKDTFEGQDVYIISVTLRAGFDVVDLHFSRLAQIDGAGNVVARHGMRGEHFFPLTLGRTFTRHEDNPRRTAVYKYRVENFVDVRTPAGSFQTVKLVVHGDGSWNGPYGSFSHEGVMYFARAAKVFVKSSTQEQAARSTTMYSEELASYKVAAE